MAYNDGLLQYELPYRTVICMVKNVYVSKFLLKVLYMTWDWLPLVIKIL